MNNIDPIGPSPAEVEGFYVIQNIPENSEDFIGGEYFAIDSYCHEEGCDLRIRPDTKDPKCAPEFPTCLHEIGRWFLAGDKLSLTVESVSIVGRVDGDVIIFENDPCGDRENREYRLANDCPVIRRLGGNTYVKTKPQCLTIDEARVKAFDLVFKVPSWLPAGHEYKCAYGGGAEIYLIFAPRQTEVIRGSMDELENGAIVIFVFDESKFIGEANWGSRNTTEMTMEHCSSRGSLHMMNDRILACVRESCVACFLRQEELPEIVRRYDTETDVIFYDGKVRYIITAYLPSRFVIPIAESIVTGR